jgi:hypothetical protein
MAKFKLLPKAPHILKMQISALSPITGLISKTLTHSAGPGAANCTLEERVPAPQVEPLQPYQKTNIVPDNKSQQPPQILESSPRPTVRKVKVDLVLPSADPEAMAIYPNLERIIKPYFTKRLDQMPPRTLLQRMTPLSDIKRHQPPVLGFPRSRLPRSLLRNSGYYHPAAPIAADTKSEQPPESHIIRPLIRYHKTFEPRWISLPQTAPISQNDNSHGTLLQETIRNLNKVAKLGESAAVDVENLRLEVSDLESKAYTFNRSTFLSVIAERAKSSTPLTHSENLLLGDKLLPILWSIGRQSILISRLMKVARESFTNNIEESLLYMKAFELSTEEQRKSTPEEQTPLVCSLNGSKEGYNDTEQCKDQQMGEPVIWKPIKNSISIQDTESGPTATTDAQSPKAVPDEDLPMQSNLSGSFDFAQPPELAQPPEHEEARESVAWESAIDKQLHTLESRAIPNPTISVPEQDIESRSELEIEDDSGLKELREDQGAEEPVTWKPMHDESSTKLPISGPVSSAESTPLEARRDEHDISFLESQLENLFGSRPLVEWPLGKPPRPLEDNKMRARIAQLEQENSTLRKRLAKQEIQFEETA